MDVVAKVVDTSTLVDRVAELQHERNEKQQALEVLIHRVEGLQYEMDEKTDIVEALTRRVEELQRERDELRKDIEQLCMHQAGPGYTSVATRMLSQRTAALEQDIEGLQKKLGGCLKKNQNLQEELAEAYRVKSQLADLYGAELSKNKELQKQVRFFQSSVAQAFAERDNALLEYEKAKEREEAGFKKFADFEERTREYQSDIEEQKQLNDDLQVELAELKARSKSSLKVIQKFYEVRCKDCDCPSDITFEEKCSVLLDDCPDNWSFRSNSETSTSKYIASLEEENGALKAKIAKLQNDLRMGLEIEQQMQKNARALDKRQALYDEFMRNGLPAVQKFYRQQRDEIMKILDEELYQLSTVVNEIQDKLSQIRINAETIGNPVREMQCCGSRCKDVHVTMDVGPGPKGDAPAGYSAIFDDSKMLAQALQEKMEALMLFSQEQERYLLEKQRNQVIIEDLQKNVSQVKDEKVKVLMELAKLKEDFLLLKGSTAKDGHVTVDPSKIIPGHDQQGMLKTILKRTSLRHWIRKENSNIGHESSDGNDHTICNECSVDLARLKVENATFLECCATMERLTSSVHRLHILLMKANDDVKSACSLENTYEALNSLITEANLMKTALGVVLPVSWSGDSSGAITYDALYDPSDSPTSSKSKRVDPLSSAGMEMVELLILAADILKESFVLKK